ncbi:hypothetical protein GcM1_241088 [Golovinomyces cichoracearum]|uniref:Uncharacterized protein n=1 Tax=Golovinomyces cichoracearum TaxID=62708 RepID=A0A420IHT4_9PEZI|nr:hypothetical protein GcM1_241088 [Golovinomyces cichoracearum]
MEEEDVRSIFKRLLLYGTLLIRILGGGVLLGFTLPDFTPTCVARRSNITGSIVVIVLDGLILGILVTNAFLMLRRDYQRNGSFHVMSRSGASIFGILGFTIWSGTSIPMILGFSDFTLSLKTILPAFGLLILIGIIGIFSSYLADSRKEYITSSEASSPFMPPIKPSPNAMKKVAETGSPASGYVQSRNLFVVNPSATPRDSSSPFSFGRKNAQNTATTPKNSVSNLSDQGSFTPKFTKNWQFKNYSESNISQNSSNDTPGYRGSSGIFPLHDDNQAALAPAILQDDKIQNGGEITTNTAASPKRNFLKWPSKAITQNKQNIRNLPISKPIVNDGNNFDSESFVRIPTIELEQAVINDRLRRDAQAENLSFSDAFSPKKIFPRLLDLKVKNEGDQIQSNNEITAISNLNTQIETVVSAPKSEAAAVTPRKFDNDDTIIKKFDTQPSIMKIKNISEYNNEIGITTSVLLSPVPSEIRRRLASKADNMNSPSSSQASPKDSERIMFVNEIVYDYPNLINDIMKQTLVKYPDISKANQTESPNLNHSTTTEPLNSEKSVIHRPRPIQRRMSRFITTGRRRSKSLFVPKTNSNIALLNVTCLDPLPKPQPLPTRAANLKRLLPDDSKNMDNEDRMKYLFPAPPAPPTNLKNMPNVMRRLSLPSLHLIPSSQNYDNLNSFSRPKQEFADFRGPEVISKQIFKTPKPNKNESNQVSQTELSSNVYLTDLNTEKIQKLPRTSKLSKTDVNVPDKNLFYSEEKQFEALQSSLSQTPIDDDLSDWDWLAELDPLKSKNNSRSRSVDKGFSSEDKNSRLSFDLNENEEGQEIVTFMLEPSSLSNNEVNRAKQHSVTADLTQNRQENLGKNQEIQIPSFKINQKSIPILAEMKKSRNFSVGESIPSFSEKREESSQVHRKPPALILNDKNIDQGAIFQNSQLTPPSEPSASLNEREQLSISTVDLQQRESLGSIIQRFPMAFSSQDSGQTPLLRKLEIEIEEQSNHWHDMQNDLDRSSIFTTSSLQNKFMRGSKRLLTSSYMANFLRSPESRISISSSLSRDIAIDSWQQKLAETQNSYTNLYDQRSSRFSLLNIRLSNPTPPGSLHSESNSISEDLTDIETPNSKTFATKCEHTMLWSPNSLPSRKLNRGLWNTLTALSIGTNGEPPARNLRPQKRFVRQNLSISSSNLWMKKKLTNINFSPVGLWCLNPSSPGKIVSSQEATEKTNIDINIIDSDEVMDEIIGNAEEFDESILIKIASILKISNIPSKKSLMPPTFDEQSDHKFTNFVSYPTDFPFPIKVSDFKAKISKPTLWSHFNHTQIINRSVGLPEPSPEVWEALNCSSRSFIRSKTRQFEDLPLLGPKTLWTESKTKDHNRISDKVWITHETFKNSESKKADLWTLKTHNHLTDTRKSGLFSVPQSGLLIRSTQMPPSGHQISKKGRNVVRGLSTLSSRDLWVAKSNPIKTTNWISVNCVEQSHKSNLTSSPKKSDLLWTPKTHNHLTDTRKSGLFSVPQSGLLIRSTQMPPSGHQISKKGRNVVRGLSTLSSRDLWVAKSNPIKTTNWISVNCVEQSHKSNLISSPKKSDLLWTKKPALTSRTTTGIFDPFFSSSSYYQMETSSTLPGVTPRRPHLFETPLDQLVSNRLWEKEDFSLLERDWISESSIRPHSRTNSLSYSVSSSSSRSEISSIFSMSTRASSIWTTYELSNYSAVPLPSNSISERKLSEKNSQDIFK